MMSRYNRFMPNQPIRINTEALAAWKQACGIPLSDYAAANAAVSLAATWRELEAEAHAGGIFFLLNLLRDGHIPLAALGDLEITVKGTDVRVGVPGRILAIYSVNPGNIGAMLRAARD